MSLLHAPDLAWPDIAANEIAVLMKHIPGLIMVHHIALRRCRACLQNQP